MCWLSTNDLEIFYLKYLWHSSLEHHFIQLDLSSEKMERINELSVKNNAISVAYTFKTLNRHLQLMGIFGIQLPKPFHRIPITLILRISFLSVGVIAILTSYWYFLFDTEKPNDLAQSFAVAGRFVWITSLYLISIWQRTAIENVFEIIQKTAKERKLLLNFFIQMKYLIILLEAHVQDITYLSVQWIISSNFLTGINSTEVATTKLKYYEMITSIEKWTDLHFKFMYFIFMPLFVTPFIAISFYEYFVLNHGEDSFHLILYAT